MLANIALSAIEERYWWWVKHPHDPKLRSDGVKRGANRRSKDRRAGRPVFYPVRYADDFLIFVAGSYDDAVAAGARRLAARGDGADAIGTENAGH